MNIIENNGDEAADDLPAFAKLYSFRTHHVWWRRENDGPKWEGSGGGYTYTSDFLDREAPLLVLWESVP